MEGGRNGEEQQDRMAAGTPRRLPMADENFRRKVSSIAGSERFRCRPSLNLGLPRIDQVHRHMVPFIEVQSVWFHSIFRRAHVYGFCLVALLLFLNIPYTADASQDGRPNTYRNDFAGFAGFAGLKLQEGDEPFEVLRQCLFSKYLLSFASTADEIYKEEKRDNDWATHVEREVTEVASHIETFHVAGACRASICRYDAVFDNGADIYGDMRAFSPVVEGNLSKTIYAVETLFFRNGPGKQTYYVFKAVSPMNWKEPLLSKLPGCSDSKN